jgi:hypothetical protein
MRLHALDKQALSNRVIFKIVGFSLSWFRVPLVENRAIFTQTQSSIIFFQFGFFGAFKLLQWILAADELV